MSKDAEENRIRLEKRLENLEKRVSRLETTRAPQPRKSTTKLTSIREFLRSKSAGSDIDKTLAVGYFLETEKEISPFTTEDLRSGFLQARESVPQNLNDTVNKNIKKGYMMEAGEEKGGRKAWTLTNLGERFVNGNLQGRSQPNP